MSQQETTGDRFSRSHWRIVLLASLGGSLEFYDFIIYGFFAQYISKQFFPTSDVHVSMILSFSVLALGYFARPIAGVVLGYFGDRIGRRPVFIASVGLTTAATILIGLLPGYAQWGLAAPLLLVALRLVQGMCFGGELPGALTYVIEAAPRRAGLACSIITLCLNLGVLVAILVNLVLQHALTADEMARYGWRLAYLLGGAVGLVSVLLRRSLEESPAFLRLHDHVERHPLRTLLREHTGAMLLCAGIAASMAGFNGILYGFLPAYLGQGLHYPPPEIASAMTWALVTSSIGLVIAGWAGDYIPRRVILGVGALVLGATIWPIMDLISGHGADLTWLMVLMSAAFSITSGIWPSLFAAQFPTAVRFSGIALSYNITVTLLSGCAPLIAAMLIGLTGNQAAPALWVIAMCVVTFVASFVIPRHRPDAQAAAALMAKA